jgi:hypothetical protein
MRWLVLLAAACGFREGHAPGDAAVTVADVHADVSIDVPTDAPAAPFAMSGQHWHLPCTSADLGNYNCYCASGPQDEMVTIGGTSSQRWAVTVRIRGVMEAIGYNGGLAGTSGWYVGGTPGDTADNYYELSVSLPAQHYYLNRGTPTGQQSFLYDYMATFEVDGGATITYESNGQDGLQWGNYGPTHMPWTIPNVTTTPSPYVGQFAQLDVVSASPL